LGLGAPDVRDDRLDRLVRTRQRKQVTGFAPTRAYERDVLTHQRRIEPLRAPGEVRNPLRVNGFRTAEGELDTVRYDRGPGFPELRQRSRYAVVQGLRAHLGEP